MKHFFLALIFAFVASLSHSQTFEWAKTMSGINPVYGSYGESIVVDDTGNIYTAGYFDGTLDFDPGAGVFNLTSAGDVDFFVVKLGAAGNFIWAIRIGGLYDDTALSIALDDSSNVYITGAFDEVVDFDPGAGTYNLNTLGAGRAAFVLKLNAAGNFIWAKQIEGTLNSLGNALVLDTLSNVYYTGYFRGTADFDPGIGVYNLSAVGNRDIFIAKLDVAGNFVWAKQMQGSMDEEGRDVALDALGNVFITGIFQDTVDFDPGVNTVNLSSLNGEIFVAKLDNAGNFVWVKQMGGGDESSRDIVVDITGNVYTTGSFHITGDFDPGPNVYNLTFGGGTGFVSKLDAQGNFVWAKKIGGGTTGWGMVTDMSGNIYFTGTFSGAGDFDPGPNTYNLTAMGSSDIFIYKLDGLGNLVWVQQIGGANTEGGFGIAIDPSENIYTTGYFSGIVDFNPNIGTDTHTSLGINNLFIHKMNQCGTSNILTQNACDSYTLNGQTYTISGIYTQTFTNSVGCDSMLILNLSINPSSNVSITQTACDTYTLNGQTYTSSGVYTQTLTNVSGCDSLISLNLTINLSTNATITQTACDTYTLNGQTYTSSGIYTQTLTNGVGCDSVITLNLTINPIPNTSITQNGAVLTASATNATYQWVNCNGNFPIPGATSQTYTPTINGFYAVIVTQLNCIDTANCYLVTNVAIEENSLRNQIKAYPNPNDGLMMIDLGKVYEGVEVSVYDLIGQELLFKRFEHGQVLEVEIPVVSGIYFVSVKLGNGESITMKVARE